MTTLHSVHAYRTLSDVQFRIRTLNDAHTGAELERVAWHDDPDFGRRLVDLTECSDWLRLRIQVECDIEGDSLKLVIGDRELPENAVVCIAVIGCRSTKLRRAVPLTRGATGKFEGALVVDREDVASDFELRVRVARSSMIAHAEPQKATFEGAILGESEPVAVVVEKRALPYLGQFRVVWRDFASAEEDELKRAAGSPLFVRTDGPPTVLLNDSITDLKTILTGSGSTPVEVALRNALGASIGGAVWRQLTFAALASLEMDAEVDHDNGAEVRSPADWKGHVARTFVQYAFPDISHKEALEQAYLDVRDPAAAPRLVGLIGAFADENAKTKKLFTQALRTIRQVGEEV